MAALRDCACAQLTTVAVTTGRLVHVGVRCYCGGGNGTFTLGRHAGFTGAAHALTAHGCNTDVTPPPRGGHVVLSETGADRSPAQVKPWCQEENKGQRAAAFEGWEQWKMSIVYLGDGGQEKGIPNFLFLTSFSSRY